MKNFKIVKVFWLKCTYIHININRWPIPDLSGLPINLTRTSTYQSLLWGGPSSLVFPLTHDECFTKTWTQYLKNVYDLFIDLTIWTYCAQTHNYIYYHMFTSEYFLTFTVTYSALPIGHHIFSKSGREGMVHLK